jgi:hypothetical protein
VYQKKHFLLHDLSNKSHIDGDQWAKRAASSIIDLIVTCDKKLSTFLHANKTTKDYIQFLGTDHLTWRGGYGFLFRSEFFFWTTQELEYYFVCRAKRELYFQNLTLGYMTKTLNQIIFFFLHQNHNIFFSNIGNQNIFLEKNHNPPPFS